MSFNVSAPRAAVDDPYFCVIIPPAGYKEYAGPSVDTGRRTMVFKYLHMGGAGAYDWALGVPRVDGPINDEWEFIFLVSTDGGTRWTESARKKPVMMSTSGGGGFFTKPAPYKKAPSIWDNIFFWRK